MEHLMIDWRAPALMCALLLVGCASNDAAAPNEPAAATATSLPATTEPQPTAASPAPTEAATAAESATPVPVPTPTTELELAPTPIPKATVTPPAPTADPDEPVAALQGGTVMVSYQGGDFPSALTGIIDTAKADLAARTSKDPTEINVVLVDEVVWSNAGLGCPQPGMAYAQVTIDGLRIILGVDGVRYDYRTGGLDEVRLCE